MRVKVEEATENPEQLVVRCARNDYKENWIGDQEPEETIREIQREDETLEDAKRRFLVRTLIKKGHFGPFEHPQITFAIEGVSRSLMAQITRHRVGITFDIQSQRYVDFSGKDASELIKTPESVTDANAGNRDPDKKSNEEIMDEFGIADEDELEEIREWYFNQAVEKSVDTYNSLRDLGVPPEDARFCLPIGSKVNITTSMTARTLLHIADMRAQPEAQWEVAELTDEMLDLAQEWMPHTFDYYKSEMIHRKNRLAP